MTTLCAIMAIAAYCIGYILYHVHEELHEIRVAIQNRNTPDRISNRGD